MHNECFSIDLCQLFLFSGGLGPTQDTEGKPAKFKEAGEYKVGIRFNAEHIMVEGLQPRMEKVSKLHGSLSMDGMKTHWM